MHTIIPDPRPADFHVFWNTVLVSKAMFSQDNNLVKVGFTGGLKCLPFTLLILSRSFLLFNPNNAEPHGCSKVRKFTLWLRIGSENRRFLPSFADSAIDFKCCQATLLQP
jgi:hypothetical protein